MAETTLMPFSILPSCAYECVHLYDANAACVPPAVTTAALVTYANCFCSDTRVAPFSTGTAGVCDTACTTESGGLGSIHTWFSSFCSVNVAAYEAAATTGAAATAATSGTANRNGTSSDSGKGQSTGQAWLSSHKQWVAFIVIVVVGIALIWIGAAMWRRRYLRNKDRQFALDKSLAAHSSAGPNIPSSGSQSQADVHNPHVGVFAPANPNIEPAYNTEKTQPGSTERRRP
ncbi:hypothetical protein CMQ_270 [Grosmannia clavigera kw1407]|uniref:Integral membrane protein n=1 Tax=Grosmannia clavigera (strain kw1407 / UAMH 11150) TaxID=655863 RepID=F0XQV4_GROCL|nr:uncharacterized protein CMQ_270 [Grosmannia clavigera kw1407]EFW99952.1 hypothetical protein CMQ_270 [Grosmannia clavigera kw1407]